MGYKIVELQSDAEFLELADVEFTSFSQPYCPLLQLYFPHGTEPAARAKGLKEAAERQALWHGSDPTSHWVKAVDTDSGKLLGAALWYIYETNPFAEPSHDEVTWYPEGTQRDIANALIGQFFTPRATTMAKPHCFLNILFTAPEARKQGIGRDLVVWGLDEAKKRGIETYLDATIVGRPLYLSLGFTEWPSGSFSMDEFPDSEDKRALEKLFVPFTWYPMHMAVQK